jgi:hypothetical protein
MGRQVGHGLRPQPQVRLLSHLLCVRFATESTAEFGRVCGFQKFSSRAGQRLVAYNQYESASPWFIEELILMSLVIVP